MELAEVFLIAIRWAHLLAAVAFVGATFVSLVLPNSSSAHPPSPTVSAFGAAFRELVDISVPVFLLTGAIMTFDRLSTGQATTLYVAVLGAKIALAVPIFYLAFRMRRLAPFRWPTYLATLAGLGAIVLLLAIILRVLQTP